MFDGISGLLEAKQVYEAFRPYQKVASIKLIKTTSQIEPVQFVKMLHRFDRGSREVKGVVIICGHRNTVEIIKEVYLGHILFSVKLASNILKILLYFRVQNWDYSTDFIDGYSLIMVLKMPYVNSDFSLIMM